MPIDFPSGPTVGQKYTFNSIVYTWTGTTWTASGNISQFNSPILTGSPTAPTAPLGDNSQQIATTAFVQSLLPSGSTLVFQQTTPPLGWTKQTTHNDKSLRVVSGAASNGGVQPFSTVFSRITSDSFTLTANEMPSHGHGVSDPTHAHGIGDPGHLHASLSCVNGPDHYDAGGSEFQVWGPNSNNWYGTDSRATGIYTGGAGTGIGIQGAGGSAGHSHGMDIRVLYVDVIIAVKN